MDTSAPAHTATAKPALATPHQQATPPDRLLRLPAVEALTGLKKSAIYARMNAGDFPACIKLGLRASAWGESAVQAWIQSKLRGAGDSK